MLGAELNVRYTKTSEDQVPAILVFNSTKVENYLFKYTFSAQLSNLPFRHIQLNLSLDIVLKYIKTKVKASY
jgi:hypothetical protein